MATEKPTKTNEVKKDVVAPEKIVNDRSRNFGGRKDFRKNQEKKDEFDTIAIDTRRVTKVTKGAKRFRFSAIVVVGNRKGRVGVGLGKGKDPKESIDKAAKFARQNLIEVVLEGDTIPHEITADYGAAKIIMKPASKGTGIIAGGSVRAVFDLAGIKDIRGKILGTNNKINNVYCAMKALSLLRNERL